MISKTERQTKVCRTVQGGNDYAEEYLIMREDEILGVFIQEAKAKGSGR